MRKEAVKTIIYDVLLLISLFVLFILFVLFLKTKAFYLQQVDYSSFFSGNTEAINENFNLLKAFFIWMVSAIIFFFLIGIALFTLFKGFIWNTLLKKSLTFSYLYRYFFLNVAYGIIFVFAFSYIILNLRNIFLIISVILVFLHFHFINSYKLAKEGKFFNSIKYTFTSGFTNFPKLIKPYIFVLSLPVLVFLIFKIFPVLPYKYLLFFILIIAYCSIARIYIKSYLDKFSHEKK